MPGQQRRLRLAILLAAAVLMAALLGGTVMVLDRMRETAEASARQAVERAAGVVEAAVNRHLLAVDGMLAGLPALVATLPRGAGDDGAPSPAAANRVLRDLNFQNFTFRDLMLVRPDGRVWAAALPGSRLRPAPLDPAALHGALGSVGAASILGPAQNPTTGEWAVFMARQVAAPGVGSLLAVAEVPVSLFATILGPFGEMRGLRITVERGDGQVLTSMPHDESRIGRRLSTPALPANGVARMATGRFTGVPVLIAARATLYKDIYVSASVETGAALAEWRGDRARLLGGVLGIGVLLAAFTLGLDHVLRQRERSEAARAATQVLLENALEALPDGFIMFDAEDRLIVTNQRYRDLYAVSLPFIRPGMPFADLIRGGALRGQYPQAGEDIEAFVAQTTAWHRGDHPPMERLLPDGRWLLVTERRTPDGGTVGIRTDITALKRAMADLAAARDAAAAATDAKSRFLARMSHELRTPLNGVLGLAQVLARDPTLPAEARARAATLEMAGRHLVAVANDVLDLARIEAGRLELQPGPAALPALLGSCLTLIHPAAQEKRLDLAAALAPDLPGHVLTDQTRLRQLLLNLLSNAVKFSPEGARVELRARTLNGGRPDAAGRVGVRLEVRDEGPGIPEAARSAVFGDFVQLERTGTSDGAGLGLAISAHIVGRMGGRIGCAANEETRDGRGAVFWAELPFPPAEAPAGAALPAAGGAAPAGAAAAVAAGRPLRILVADDVPANLAVARALLQSAGHSVECVPDGALAVEAVARANAAGAAGPPFDAVLMDVMMPGTDGLEATRRIRALGGPAALVPVVAATAGAFAEDVAACRAAGMDDHVAKPIDRHTLLRKLRAIAEARCGAASAAPPAPDGGADARPPSPVAAAAEARVPADVAAE